MSARLSQRRAVWGLLGLALAGCGPTVPLQAGLRQAGASVVFGTPPPEILAAPTPPPQFPPPAVNVIPNFPAPLEQPPLFTLALPQPTPDLCPAAPPGAVLQAPAPAAPATPPAAATYAFRYQGSKTLGSGSAQQSFPMPGNGTRTVAPASIPEAVNGSYAFSVTEKFNRVTTADTYWVVPNGPGGSSEPDVQGTTPAAGMYLVEMTVTDPATGTDDFKPNPPVELMPFPASAGQQVDSSGVDGTDGQAMQIGPAPPSSPTGSSTPSQVTGHGNVDACGRLLDAWQVVLYGAVEDARAPATSTSSGCASTRTFQLTLDVGTEYGGISLSDHLIENGQDQLSCKPFTYDITATIDQEPER
jgi:hypothetical protein